MYKNPLLSYGLIMNYQKELKQSPLKIASKKNT